MFKPKNGGKICFVLWKRRIKFFTPFVLISVAKVQKKATN